MNLLTSRAPAWSQHSLVVAANWKLLVKNSLVSCGILCDEFFFSYTRYYFFFALFPFIFFFFLRASPRENFLPLYSPRRNISIKKCFLERRARSFFSLLYITCPTHSVIFILSEIMILTSILSRLCFQGKTHHATCVYTYSIGSFCRVDWIVKQSTFICTYFCYISCYKKKKTRNNFKKTF